MPPLFALNTQLLNTLELDVPSRSMPTSPQPLTVLPETVTHCPSLPQMHPFAMFETELLLMVRLLSPGVDVTAESPPHQRMPCGHELTALFRIWPPLENPRLMPAERLSGVQL